MNLEDLLFEAWREGMKCESGGGMCFEEWFNKKFPNQININMDHITVEQLIEALQGMPKDKKVIFAGYNPIHRTHLLFDRPPRVDNLVEIEEEMDAVIINMSEL